MIIGPTFFSRQIGDHTPGDGLTRLQTAFAGGSSADISQYAIGSGTINGSVAVTDGLLTVTLTALSTNRISWNNNDLRRLNSTALTVEFFVRVVEVTVNHASSIRQYASLDNFDNMDDGGGNGGTHEFGVGGYSGGINPFRAQLNTWYSGDTGYDAYGAGFVHVAYVWDASPTGSLSIYIDGVRVVLQTGGSHWISGDTILYLGGASPIFTNAVAEFTGVRVRRAEMYSGASFVPPASPADWGPP